MPDLVPVEIERGWNLINEGKRDEALELVNELEKKENLTTEEKLKNQINIGRLIFYLGEIQRAFKIGEEIFKESQKLGYPHLSLKAINLKLLVIFNIENIQERLDLSSKEINRGESILTSLSYEDRVEFGKEGAKFFQIKGLLYMRNEDIALDSFKKSLDLIKQLDQNKSEVKRIEKHVLENLGLLYANKREYEDALKYYNKSLMLNTENKKSRIIIDGYTFRGLGNMYYIKGDLDSAINYFEQGITIYEDFPTIIMGFLIHNPQYSPYPGIINCLTTNGDIKLAQYYLQKCKQLIDRSFFKGGILAYNLARVRILKYSTRIRDLVEAENILKDILEKQKDSPVALSQICDLYLKELRLTNDLTILDEISGFITRMLEIAKKENSYALLARTKLLQAKIALIQMNMGDARQFLTQGQKIADEHGYGFLAKAISIEHDNLLEQLDKWEGLKKGNAPASERIKLASVDGVIEYLVESGTIEKPEVIDEQPVVLLIIGEGGILLFSYSFTDEWKFDEELFSGFLTAFNSISDEIFSEGLDRVKFGKHTVLVEPIKSYSVCYLFEGQTYLAKGKLKKFTEYLRRNIAIQQTLNKFYKTSQVLELKDFPFLESLITEIFF